jgi:hypothetical protein
MKHQNVIDAFSDIFGLAPPMVGHVVRTLKRAGLLTSGARGVNAPDMTLVDAVKLVIFFAASDRPVEAVEVVQRFGNAKARSGYTPNATDGLEGFQKGAHLGPVLAAMMLALKNGKATKDVALEIHGREAHAVLAIDDSRIEFMPLQDDDPRDRQWKASGIKVVRLIEPGLLQRVAKEVPVVDEELDLFEDPRVWQPADGWAHRNRRANRD